MLDNLPIFIVLALLGLGFREEMTEIAFDGGVHSSHPWNDPAIHRMTAGISGFIPLGESHGLQLGAAYSRKGDPTCRLYGWDGTDDLRGDVNGDGDVGGYYRTPPCAPNSPDLVDLWDSAETSVLWKAIIARSPTLDGHVLFGPAVGVPIACQEENRTDGTRQDCFGDALDLEVGLVVGAGLRHQMTERLDLTMRFRYSFGLKGELLGFRTSSLLAGLVYRRR